MLNLQCGVQFYEWGKIGEESLIYQLTTENKDSKQNYAELWMGSHVSLPSSIIDDQNVTSLLDEIKINPLKYLGNDCMQKYGSNSLPFLFKVLSVNKALSIQVHPNKIKAQELHQKFPDIYKDGNHKPEMTLALSEFEALCNFVSKKQLLYFIQNIQQFGELFDSTLVQEYQACESDQEKKFLKNLINQMMSLSSDKITNQVESLVLSLKRKQSNQENLREDLREQLILTLHNHFQFDSGILFQYFLNYITLKPGQCLLMEADEPHAYLKGECIECMASSDNVIRLGLTPKFKDTQTLLSILRYESKIPSMVIPEIIQNCENVLILKYQTSYQEFQCFKIELFKQQSQTQSLVFSFPAIIIFLNGEGNMIVNGDEKHIYQKGNTKYICPNIDFTILSVSEYTSAYLCVSN